MNAIQKVICLCGNDGTGKSTLSTLIPELFPQLYVIERSSKQTIPCFEALRQEIKHIDFLTYRYFFEQDRAKFQPSTTVKTDNGEVIPVYWVMLHLQPEIIFKRISNRLEMGIYESKKCVEYYSFVYLELAAYYGMSVVQVNAGSHQNATKIAQIINCGAASEIQKINLKTITAQKIKDLDVESQIIKALDSELVHKIISKYWLKQIKEDQPISHFYFPQIEKIIGSENDQDQKLCYQLVARWILNKFPITKDNQGHLSIKLTHEDINATFSFESPSFVYYIEGESKLIYSLRSSIPLVEEQFASRIWILLKSTIYSHTKQHTGQIADLGKVRAVGSNLFLEMLRRNNMHHAYIAINKEGIIFSRKIQTNNVEVVFKREYVGTDKHSYSLLNQQMEVVSDNQKYKCGIYVRFDWRNPNHFLSKYPQYVLNLNPYYYIIEKHMGKQIFFSTFLNSSKVTPWGDKCISEDLISNYIQTSKIKKKVLALYCSFSYYCKKVGLDIIDGCFMLDKCGDTVWSEINPDCMRVKKNELNSRENYDKDIWRIGGSSSKDKIMEKWNLFNKLLIEYFVNNRFHETQLLQTTPLSYPKGQQADLLLKQFSASMSKEYIQGLTQLSVCTQKIKEIIATIDISNSKPMLVKSSQLSENHSECSLTQAHSYIRVLPKIVLVDLDAAMDKQTNNRNSIKSLAMKPNSNIFGVGGGIRSKQIVDHYLFDLLIPKVILSTNLELLKELPADIISQRVIVELSINQQNEILTHGRKVNTHENAIKKMVEIARLGVTAVSLTFNHKEGHLAGIPREQFRDIMFQIPGPIQKVIIAGGITSLDDLKYIWGFPKAVPQLGSAIWKHKISIPEICNSIINFNSDGICPAIISDSSQKLLGQIFMNRQAIKNTCQTRQLYRFSRKFNRLIKKGEESGNIQKITAFRFDCDMDCLNIIVENSERPFCHTKSQSCFDFESQPRTQNIISLQNHILRKKQTGSGYSKRMQQNENLALSKFIEESFEFTLTKNRIVEEGADMISHMLMYLNAKGISFDEIMKELQVRSAQIKPHKKEEHLSDTIDYIGVMGGKHFEKIDKAMLDTVGIRVNRPKDRSLKLDYAIQDQSKFDIFFKGKKVRLIGIKSKDMAFLLHKKCISFCFNYSIMMENSPKMWVQHFKEPITEIKLVLLERKDQCVDPFSWNPDKKGRVVAQYPRSVANYFQSLGLNEDCYSIIQVSGGTESYLSIDGFDYCDAIVESGRTIEDNNLKIVKILAENIQAALYTLIQ